MVAWVLLLYFFSESIYFSTLTLFGFESGSSFLFYNLLWSFIISLISLYVFMRKALKKGEIRKIKIVVFLTIIFLVVNLFYSYLFYGQSPIIFQMIKYFFAFTLPAVLLALSMNDGNIKSIFHKFRFINIYLTLAFGITYLKTSNGGVSQFLYLGEASHLIIGYTMATLFPFNFIKFTTEKKLPIKLIYFCLFVFNVFLILVSGSKGALVSVVFNFLIMIYVYIIKKRKTFKSILLFSALALIGFMSLKRTSIEIGNSFDRILTLFNSDIGIASSGRDIFYNMALSGIKENPLFGNGLGVYAQNAGQYVYPHNIVLEILHDFGIIGFGVFLIVMLFALNKITVLFKQDDYSYHLLAFFFICTIISLMFSGSYLVSMQFWVSTLLVLTVPTKKEQQIVKSQSDTITLTK